MLAASMDAPGSVHLPRTSGRTGHPPGERFCPWASVIWSLQPGGDSSQGIPRVEGLRGHKGPGFHPWFLGLSSPVMSIFLFGGEGRWVSRL